MKVPRRGKRRARVPINAMSDIAFLLLMFIMLISLINYRPPLAVDYPRVESAPREEAAEDLRITIDRSGRLYLDGRRADFQEVEGIIARRVSADPSVAVAVLADRNTPYRHVEHLLAVLQRLQHPRVTLIAEPAPGAAQ